ncbi:hypothetical protein Scep_012076 [Stephania cephalantha]|uniref:RNA polymerase I-specific transcription initiation factor RRN3 n=1 Tax=Stephania cephalantha TaxID=152367 RepID=A0AAP0P6F1_9MAGN
MGVEVADTNTTFTEMENLDFSDSEIVSFVRHSLQSALEGDSNHYNQLIGIMNSSYRLAPDEVALLSTGLKALSKAVFYIDITHHGKLLSAIFGMSLWSYGPDVMDALVELIIALAASGGDLVESCLQMLVSNFIPPKALLHNLSQPWCIKKKQQVLERVHSALINIAYLVPVSPLMLEHIIPRRMPHLCSEEVLIITYVENMLKLESSDLGRLVGSTMIVAVVDRLVDLDVEIGWDKILQDDSNKGIFEMELEVAPEDSKDVSFEVGKATSGSYSLAENVVAEQLDSLMVLMCEHLKSCADAGRLSEVFDTLLDSFRITVLKAYKSKFAQFVVFYACSLDPEHCGLRFANMLEKIFMQGTDPLTRMSAVSYLASYLSRGRFIPSSLVAGTLKRLVDWCLEYCHSRDGKEAIVNPEVHRVFYSGCQAVMYLLCFRMRLMVEVSHLKSLLHSMPLERILRHPLDPLKVCLPSIVSEFLQQAKAAHLCTVSDKFIFNNLLESDLSKAYGGIERLDMFFPFDPCLLKNCDRFIRPNFVRWSMDKTIYDDDEDGLSDDEIDMDFVDGKGEHALDYDMGRSFDDRELDLVDECAYSLNNMSFTPKSSNFLSPMQMPALLRPSTSPPGSL